MQGFSFLRRLVERIEGIRQETVAMKEGIVNQSALLNDKLSEIIGNAVNEQRIINDKLSELIAVSSGQQKELNDNLLEILRSLDNEQRIINDKLGELIASSVNEQRILNDKLNAVIGAVLGEQAVLDGPLAESDPPAPSRAAPSDAPRTDLAETGEEQLERAGKAGIDDALSRLPLLRAPKTYNTDHPDYDPALVRNFPGSFYNADAPSTNPVLGIMRSMMRDGVIADDVWAEVLESALAELRATPGAPQLFERQEEAANYFGEINRQFGGHYLPGWMNLDDALFLYWLIRQSRPRTIVETGVCNGFSAGVAVLALARNGNDGNLHAIGLAEVFNPDDPRWTQGGRVFGEVVVGGKGLGWMIPNPYRHWANIYNGDARTLLPEVAEKLDGIDLFFHDSDHSYDHMMFEFVAARRKLARNAIVVADNIAWNSSLWDFADECGVPAYNFRGSVGVAFF